MGQSVGRPRNATLPSWLQRAFTVVSGQTSWSGTYHVSRWLQQLNSTRRSDADSPTDQTRPALKYVSEHCPRCSWLPVRSYIQYQTSCIMRLIFNRHLLANLTSTGAANRPPPVFG